MTIFSKHTSFSCLLAYLSVCLSHFSSHKMYVRQLAGSRRTSHAGCFGFKLKAWDRAY